MNVNDKTVVVTGGARGIGKALAIRFAKEGARVVVSDLKEETARRVAEPIEGLAVACDVSKESAVQNLVARAEDRFGPIDLFCSNAGVFFGEPDLATSAGNDHWQTCWDIHVMAHVYAARAVLPGMIERGGGYLLNMASAAGLLSQIGDAAYSATKHAAVGFAESLAITHGDDGVKVSVICPQFVATPDARLCGRRPVGGRSRRHRSRSGCRQRDRRVGGRTFPHPAAPRSREVSPS